MERDGQTGTVSALLVIQPADRTADTEITAWSAVRRVVRDHIAARGPQVVEAGSHIELWEVPDGALFVQATALAAYRDWRECPVGEHALRPGPPFYGESWRYDLEISPAVLEARRNGPVRARFTLPAPAAARYSNAVVLRVA